MGQFFKWLVKVVLIAWILVIVITVIGCYNVPDKRLDEPPKVEVRENTKEKEVDISFFKWIRSK